MTNGDILRVGNIMSADIKKISRMATVAEAIEVLREAGVSSLVVERGDADDEFGMIVVTDIAREVIAKDRPPDRVNVYEIMSKPVLTVPESMQVKYAVRLLVPFRVSRALVVNDSREPVGIVTLRDMVLRQAAPPSSGLK
jgi:predicted transcriptional regulator